MLPAVSLRSLLWGLTLYSSCVATASSPRSHMLCLPSSGCYPADAKYSDPKSPLRLGMSPSNECIPSITHSGSLLPCRHLRLVRPLKVARYGRRRRRDCGEYPPRGVPHRRGFILCPTRSRQRSTPEAAAVLRRQVRSNPTFRESDRSQIAYLDASTLFGFSPAY